MNAVNFLKKASHDESFSIVSLGLQFGMTLAYDFDSSQYALSASSNSLAECISFTDGGG